MSIVGIYEANPPSPPAAGATRYELHGAYFDATSPPDAGEAAQKLALMKHANLKRLLVQQGGFRFAGALVPTDTNALAMLTAGAVALADEETIAYVVDGIDFGDFSGATVRAMLGGLKDFVKATFVTLRAIHAKILSGEIVSIAQIEAADWPA